jgi:hypothetical protein
MHAMRAKAFAAVHAHQVSAASAGDSYRSHASQNRRRSSSIPEATARRRIDTHLGRRQVVQEVTDHGVARRTWHIQRQRLGDATVRHLVGSTARRFESVARQRADFGLLLEMSYQKNHGIYDTPQATMRATSRSSMA